jgi:hypothetical protein
VEAQALAGVVCRVEGLAFDAGRLEVFAEVGGPPLLLEHVDDGALPVRVGVHRAGERE